MLVFGHAGITLGAALLAGTVINRRFPRNTEIEVSGAYPCSTDLLPTAGDNPGHKASWLTSFVSYVDIRLLVVGSLLPDIIDKPIGGIFFREVFSSGRIFCHTLLFLILMAAVGFYLCRHRGRTWLLVLSFGTFIHLVLDQMWRLPKTLFWPLYGLVFEKFNLINWLPRSLHTLFTNPKVFLPELVGLAVIIWFAWALLRRRQVFTFIKYGQI